MAVVSPALDTAPVMKRHRNFASDCYDRRVETIILTDNATRHLLHQYLANTKFCFLDKLILQTSGILIRKHAEPCTFIFIST